MKSVISSKDAGSVIGGSVIRTFKEKSGNEIRDAPKRTKSPPSDEWDETSEDTSATTGEFKPLANMDDIFLIRDDTDNYRYGWGRFTPDALQVLRSPVALLVVLCIIAFVNGAGIHGTFEGSAKQLQRLFNIKSDEMSYLLFAYYVGTVLAILPIGYFGSHSAHKGRWIAIGALIVTVGCMIIVIPHMTTSAEYRKWLPGGRCLPDTSEPQDCPQQNFSSSYHKFIFAFGHFVYGLGSATPHTMGIAFMDEHVSYRYSAIYTGVFRTIDVTGPMFGYFMTSYFGKGRRYKEPKPGEEETWSGTWWIPMVVCAGLSLICAFLMFGFPSQLAGMNQARTREVMEDMVQGQRVPGNAEKEWTKDVGDTGLDLIKRALRLLATPTYSALTIERIFTAFMISGVSSILTEYIEKEFSVQSDFAGYAGGIVVLAGVLGLLMGTYLEFLFEYQLKDNLLLIAATAFGGLVCAAGGLIGCDISFAGVNVDYHGNNIDAANLSSECNARCSCSLSYKAVCSVVDKKLTQYYSTCYAGCWNISGEDVHEGLNCTCAYDGSVSPEVCGEKCFYKMIAFLIALAWCSLFIHLRKNAVDQAILRFVPFKYRVVAFCFVAAFARLLGSDPSVLFFSWILSHNCVHQGGECKQTCVLYKKDLNMHVTVTLMTASTIIVLASVGAVLTYMLGGKAASSQRIELAKQRPKK